MKIIYKLTLLTIWMFLVSFNQKHEIRALAYQAYLSGSETYWKNTVKEAQSNYDQVASQDRLYQLALAQFGLLTATMSTENEELFDEYVDETLDLLEELEDRGYQVAEAKSLRASIYGYKIAYFPVKGMYLGPKNTALIDEAMSMEPESPVVQKMYAQHQYFTPEMWGGDIKNAKQAFKKSIQLFEENGQTDNWMYLDNHAWLGIIHKKQENEVEAREIWERALNIEPDFKWVGESLIPSLQ